MAGRVCGNRLLTRLMSPSPKSQVTFASAFSWIGDFFVFSHSYIYATATLLNIWICMQWKQPRHAGCMLFNIFILSAALKNCARVLRSLAIGRILFEHMSRARRPLIMTTDTHGCGLWTLVMLMKRYRQRQWRQRRSWIRERTLGLQCTSILRTASIDPSQWWYILCIQVLQWETKITSRVI